MLARGGLVISRRLKTRKALVLPITEGESCSVFAALNQDLNNNLQRQIDAFGGFPKGGQVRNLPGCSPDYDIISVTGQSNKLSTSEGRDEKAENLRISVANSIKSLTGLDLDKVEINSPAEFSTAAGESAKLTAWTYKADKRAKNPQNFERYGASACSEFEKGIILADAQNFARELMELPANLLTPKIFAQRIVDELTPLGVKVTVYGGDWIQEQKMGAFWSVAKGSIEEPQFVEMVWEGVEVNKTDKTFCMVGKGVTFDSGGISIKPSASMGDMRGDMGGAAVTVGAMYACAKLKIPGKVIAVTPLAENMPSHNASKPGDVVIARNGKSIQVDNTDAEGRLLLCDALDYAVTTYKPDAIIDSATLTGAMMIALGEGATGVFCKDDKLWNMIESSGQETGDRAWRMPHFKHYFDCISPTHNADLNNTGGREGGAATAAGFLSAFVPEDLPWAHLDIAGVMDTKGSTSPFICKGMTGRPTRTIYKLLENFHK